MNRRSFLASLGLAPVVARSYFDMGAAWQRHESGLWTTEAMSNYYQQMLENLALHGNPFERPILLNVDILSRMSAASLSPSPPERH